MTENPDKAPFLIDFYGKLSDAIPGSAAQFAARSDPDTS